MGSKWPDKSDKTAFGSATSGGVVVVVEVVVVGGVGKGVGGGGWGGGSRGQSPPSLTVWALGWLSKWTVLPML